MSELKVKWDKVLSKNSAPIIRWIDLGNGTMFRIAAFFTHGFHDMPKDGLQVSIDRCGSFLFMCVPQEWGYVSNKLFIPEADARAIADWMNAQLEYDKPQQGYYNRDYIESVHIYGLIGERWSMPLTPIIIEDKEKCNE